MKKVCDVTCRKEIKGEKVPNDQKLFSIYELHTDIIDLFDNPVGYLIVLQFLG
ncbi:MAG: hypothetical protein LBB47_05330 [Spirochaetaceae bacterium]|nr:hypothetical protein [Spirochaetaceae bacterium]